MADSKYPTAAKKKFIPKNLFTEREAEFFQKLKTGMVGLHVFPQVSMNAVLDVEQQRTWKDRIPFWAKIIDFVICMPDFRIIAMVELDGPSHDSPQQKEKDDERDAMLTEAGYIVVRYDWRKEITPKMLNKDFAKIVKRWNWLKLQEQVYKDEERILRELSEP